MRFFPRQTLPMMTLVAGLLLWGCGGRSTGPAKYRVSGKVAYQGEPVPKGAINFEPDAAKGNSGPNVSFPIENGSYDSGSRSGTLGGPYLVQITGFDGKSMTLPDGMIIPEGTPLFPPWKTEVDLPKAKHQQDFDVPATPTKKK
jgi:hypothetical protein